MKAWVLYALLPTFAALGIRTLVVATVQRSWHEWMIFAIVLWLLSVTHWRRVVWERR